MFEVFTVVSVMLVLSWVLASSRLETHGMFLLNVFLDLQNRMVLRSRSTRVMAHFKALLQYPLWTIKGNKRKLEQTEAGIKMVINVFDQWKKQHWCAIIRAHRY
jgi:hypothetical protein